MSTEPDEEPPSRRIRLAYHDGSWSATDEDAGVSVEADSREAALAALDSILSKKSSMETDPIFTAPTLSSDRTDVSENVDEYLSRAGGAKRK